MLDRESTFADPDIVASLKHQFIPVAIDQAYQRRQQDAEGEFYRKIAGQGPRNDFQRTTQGLYIASPAGTLLGFSNHRSPERIERLITTSLERYDPTEEVELIERGEVDRRFNPQLPEGGLIVRVRAKVLGGYQPTDDRWDQIFQSAVSRDNLWLTGEEHKRLVEGELPAAVARRIARFHLVDNTRGEPPMWRSDEIRNIELDLDKGKLHGKVHLETEDGERGYEAELLGFVEHDGTHVTRFELVAKGDFWGQGRFTRNAPDGRFPLVVSFELADGSDVADAIPPQGSRGWLDGYLKTEP